MPPNLPKTTVKFLVALLKNQAKVWLGEDAVGIATQTLLVNLQKQLDDWLKSDEFGEAFVASEQAQIYLQDPQNCPDNGLRHLFRDITFGDLPSVQKALTDLPRAMDANKLTETLRDSFCSRCSRSFPPTTQGRRPPLYRRPASRGGFARAIRLPHSYSIRA